jgi:ABC-type bacteriocin/lantibiotic exporter with double-glycine peptidase domain
LLAQLAAMTGAPFDHERARFAVEAKAHDGDPLSQLTHAAAEISLRISPVRRPLTQVLWLARSDTPLVFWSEVERRWILATCAGWFRIRIAEGDHPTQRTTISRAELARKLGLSGPQSEVEAGVVHSESQSQHLSSSQTGAGHAQDGHHSAHHISPVRRFLGLLRPERADILTLIVFSFFTGGLNLAAPLAVDAVVTNLAFGGQSRPYVQALVILGIALFACLALKAVVGAFQYYVAEVLQRRIFVRIASDFAYRLPRVKAEALDDIHAPELVNRFLDAVTAQKSTALLLLDGVNLVFGTLAGMVLLALYHPALLLFVAVFLGLIGLIFWPLGRGAVQTSISESKAKYELVNWFEEIAAFPFLFKGPGGYGLAYERANQIASDYLLRRSGHFRVVIRQVSALLALSVVATAALLVLGGWLVLSQQLTVGQLVASELVIGGIAGSLAKVGKTLEAWYDAMAAMDKLGHVFDLEIERQDGEQADLRQGGAGVVAENLSLSYSPHSPVFTGRSFSIRPGARAAIIGPHGSGVSSILDLLFGLRAPCSGHVSIDGLDLRSWKLQTLRERVQLLRRDEIVDGNVVDNVRLHRTDIGMDEIREALQRVGLLEELLNRPEGLGLNLKNGGAPLSGSERIRLLLARALVQKPSLLLIDELLDGLDAASFQALAKAIFAPEIPWTVVVATRDHDVTRLCDQIIEIAPCHLSDGTEAGSTP